MVVLAFIERQRVLVDGLPEQDWSLRVTQVYARRDGEWHLVHRHADPLTHDPRIALRRLRNDASGGRSRSRP